MTSIHRVAWPLAVAETVVWAALYYSFPALLPVWEQDLGWSKTEIVGALTLALILAAAFAPVTGRLIDRGHGRILFAGGAIVGAVLLVCLSQVAALWQFYLVWCAVGVTMSATLYEACFAILTRTMGDKAKRAITFVTLVAGFAGTVSFPSAHFLVGLVGWRGAVTVFAAAILAVAVPLIWYGCREADRAGVVNAPRSGATAAASLGVIRAPTFWLLALSFAMVALNHGVIITHIFPIFADRGLGQAAAVTAASLIGPMQVAGRLAMIAVERHLSVLAISICCYLALASAAIFLLGAGAAGLLVACFVICQGAGVGVISIMRPVIIATLLGRSNFGITSGTISIPYGITFALAPTIAAAIAERTSYDWVIGLALAAALVGVASLIAAWWAAASLDRIN